MHRFRLIGLVLLVGGLIPALIPDIIVVRPPSYMTLFDPFIGTYVQILREKPLYTTTYPYAGISAFICFLGIVCLYISMLMEP